jgi:hypothetical protein
MLSLIRALLWLVIGFFVTATAGCADAKGRWRAESTAEAERDLKAGKLRLKTYGLPAPWSGRFRALAREKLGVEIEAVAGCVVGEDLLERTAGYNGPMRQEINRRFGPGALDKLAEEARAQHQKGQQGQRAVEP